MLLFFDLPFADNFHLTRFLPDDEQGKINKKLDSSQFDRSTTTVTVVVVRYQTECFHVYFSDKLHVALQRKEGRRSSFFKWRIVSEMEQFCRVKLSQTFLISICGTR